MAAIGHVSSRGRDPRPAAGLVAGDRARGERGSDVAAPASGSRSRAAAAPGTRPRRWPRCASAAARARPTRSAPRRPFSTAAMTAWSRSRGRGRRPRSCERSSSVRAGTPTVAVVGDPTSPVAAGCDEVVDLSFADDRSVVQTRFVTTVVCFARAALGLDVDALVADAEAALAAPDPPGAEAIDRAVVLGREWRVGLADAAALTLRETARLWAESYPSMEYRHGPIATAGPGGARVAARPAARPSSPSRSRRPGRPWSRRRSTRSPS